MKAYTDIEQSKKLAEILSIESADMKYPYFGDGKYGATPYIGEPIEFSGGKDIPCWSLSALLNIIPKYIKQNDGRIYKFHIFNDGLVIQRWGCSYVAKDYHNRAEYLSDKTLKYPNNIYSNKHKDIIDACYEMILKLKENNLL